MNIFNKFKDALQQNFILSISIYKSICIYIIKYIVHSYMRKIHIDKYFVLVWKLNNLVPRLFNLFLNTSIINFVSGLQILNR